MGAELASAIGWSRGAPPRAGDVRGVGGVLADQPAEQTPMAPLINSKSKYVVSNTLDSIDWGNAMLVKGDLETEVSKLKERSSGDLLVSGSITLVQSLLSRDLLVQLSLLIHPLVLGSGPAPPRPGRRDEEARARRL